MIYYSIEEDEKNLWLKEDTYQPLFALKTESAFAQCNGYMGVRAAHDFRTLEENRGMFVSGLFHKAYETEVAELVNCPDLTEIRLVVEQEEFRLEGCKLLEYQRKLNLKTGELMIAYYCKLLNGLEIKLESRRFASMDQEHLLCQSLSITPLNRTIEQVEVLTGINGQITNSGVSHFNQVDCRVYDKTYMETKGYLTSEILNILCACSIKQDKKMNPPEFVLKRRSIYGKYSFCVEEGETVTICKYSYVETGENADSTTRKEAIKECIANGYEMLYQSHCKKMQEIWQYAEIKIGGASLEEKAAICFAQYHLLGMTPKHSNTSSVGAKGLTGEGYKGHVFWDTEIFVLPFFLSVFPETAKNLLLFRYRGLDGAREKAKEYNYQGAMFPWEAAQDGYEETPLYAALNIHTGKANKVWSGRKEHHVTADIVYAIWQYYRLTKDEKFMEKAGYELIFEAASFWVSRAVYQEEDHSYHILDIIGPDEYTEHIDDNAYTNYMAQFCVDLAYQLLNQIKEEKQEVYERLEQALHMENKQSQWLEFAESIYLPKPNAEGIIPQDRTFLRKDKLANFEKYKQSPMKQSVLLDYSRDEIVAKQVLKQADVVMLLNLFPQLFSADVVKKNVRFYESRTLHDSSLSYCAHAQACAATGAMQMAWEFFKKAMEVDLDDNPNDSTDGIHSASLGGIWSCVIFGFAGISYEEDGLRIHPSFPEHWKSIEFHVKIQGTYVKISVKEKEIELRCEKELRNTIKVSVEKKSYVLQKFLRIPLKEEGNDR